MNVTKEMFPLWRACVLSTKEQATFAFVSTFDRIHCLQTNTQIFALDQVTREYTEAILKIKCRLREFSYFNKKRENKQTPKPNKPTLYADETQNKYNKFEIY